MSDEVSKTIVLTGISRGLGRAMAVTFAGSGHKVLGCGRSNQAVEYLQEALGQPHEAAVVDVTDEASVQDWAHDLVTRHGAPDLLINNAGLINANANLWEVPSREFEDVVQVNILGVGNVLRHFLPTMVEGNHGVVVNFSSGWGRSVSGEVAPYCATKWAMEGLTKALAEELPSGMAAVPLNPGVINTEMLQSCFGPGADAYPTAMEWAQVAVPYLLKIGPGQNGHSLTVP